MRVCFLFILALFSSCSRLEVKKEPVDSQNKFLLKDRSGDFIVVRGVKRPGRKLVVKQEVFPLDDLSAPLEKTISVSVLGSLKTKRGARRVARPEVAQHAIWYEKKKFFSQSKVNVEKKTLDIVMKSPEERWNGKKSFPFPKGQIFCFFSQLPECARANGLLSTEANKPYQLKVIWDSFPYHQEMYEKISAGPFESATWAFDKEEKDGFRFGLLMSGQLVIYEFDRQLNFKSMFWVAQGISLIREKDGQ